MKAAFQGVHGAYSEMACKALLGPSCRPLPMPAFEDVFEAVRAGKADRGVIPIENSLAGSIHQNYDLLLAYDLHIVGETHLRVEHVLMAHASASLGTLTEVRSHPQALAQCSGFFASHRNIKATAYFDTAGAAESLVGEASPALGAIAGAQAAELYGLKVLRRNLENRSHNFTRFLLIARKPIRPPADAAAKCSVTFRPDKNQVGALFRVLGVFALRDIDLLKIESRPDPDNAFAYRFHLDLAGSPADKRVAKALDHLEEIVTDYRLLGAYARDPGFPGLPASKSLGAGSRRRTGKTP